MKHTAYYEALKGYSATILFIADFVALIFSRNILISSVLGIVFVLGGVKIYLGSKNIKRFSYLFRKGLVVEYFPPSEKEAIKKQKS